MSLRKDPYMAESHPLANEMVLRIKIFPCLKTMLILEIRRWDRLTENFKGTFRWHETISEELSATYWLGKSRWSQVVENVRWWNATCICSLEKLKRFWIDLMTNFLPINEKPPRGTPRRMDDVMQCCHAGIWLKQMKIINYSEKNFGWFDDSWVISLFFASNKLNVASYI